MQLMNERRGLLRSLAAWALACATVVSCSSPEPRAPAPELDADYLEALAAWRAERDERLRNPEGWLTLAGLYWLEEGESRFGADPELEVVFPAGKAPARIGTFIRTGDTVHLRAEPDLAPPLLHQGEPVTDMALVADWDGEPTVLEIGSLRFFVIRRAGGLVGVRLRDGESEVLAGFTGVESFPAESRWRVPARFEPYDPPKTIRIPNIVGTVDEAESPGALVFEVEGETLRLDPTGDPAEGFFVVFGDGTNGEETYGGGRFLVVDPPAEDGSVELDFNFAYNPPCVFTAYATCPLPPRQNRFAARIEAGEKVYGDPPH